MMIELANEGPPDGGRHPPESSGHLLYEALHDSPGKLGKGTMSDRTGRPRYPARGRPVSRCGLEPFRRGDDRGAGVAVVPSARGRARPATARSMISSYESAV